MLQFLRPADPVFQAIVDEALRTAHHFACDILLEEEDPSTWHARYPKTARCLPVNQAAHLYATLLNAHRGSDVWRYTDLQALVIWEALSVFISSHIALVLQHPEDRRHHRVGPFSLKTIDLQWIETLYFDNLDFLDATDLTTLTPELATMLKWSASARRAALGLRATPEDLQLTRLDRADTSIWRRHALRALDPGTPIHAYPVWPEVCHHGR